MCRTQVLVRRTRFVCILDLSSQCLSEEDTVCVYSRTQFSGLSEEDTVCMYSRPQFSVS